MLGCPIYASPELTLDLALEVASRTTPFELSSVQPDCLFYSRPDGKTVFVVQDLRSYVDYDNDIDWSDFLEHVPSTQLSRVTCARLNIEHYDFEEVKPLLLALANVVDEFWVLLPGHRYVSGLLLDVP